MVSPPCLFYISWQCFSENQSKKYTNQAFFYRRLAAGRQLAASSYASSVT
jgi:hypothetical protein